MSLIYLIIFFMVMFLAMNIFDSIGDRDMTKTIDDHIKHENITFNPYTISEENKNQLDNIMKLCDTDFRQKIKNFKTIKFDQILKRNTVILHGPPGCGKTTFVKYVSKELGKDLVSIKLNDLISPFMDMEPTRLNNCLKKINSYTNKIVFFDEIDTIINHRVQNITGNNHKNSTINIMLTWLDGINTENDGSNIIIFSTNRLDIIDSAFIDRMTNKIHFNYPNKKQLEEYWRMHLPHFTEEEILTLNKMNIKSFRQAEDLIKNSVINSIKNNRAIITLEDIFSV